MEQAEKIEKYIEHFMCGNMAVIFDKIGMDMPAKLEGTRYENTMDRARTKAEKHFTKYPEDMTNKFGDPFDFSMLEDEDEE